MEDNREIRESILRYIDALKVAQTDSEKFAALLVVAQIEKSLKLTPCEKKAVYGSLDLIFIKRLLNAKREPEGCEKGTLMSLGLTILSCMVNEIENVDKSLEVLDLIPRIIGIFYEVNRSDETGEHANDKFREDILDNIFNILLVIASSEDGCRRIMQCWSLKPSGALTKENTIKILKIVLNCIAVLKESTLLSFKEPIQKLFSQAAYIFSSTYDQNKFTILALMFELISANTEKKIFDKAFEMFSTELQFLRKGLLDILQSKVDKKYRHMSLKLISELIEIFGMNWACMICQDEDEKYHKKFLHLLVSLASVEVKMIFYDKDNDIALMSYLFAILEKSIEAIGSNEGSLTDVYLGENMAAKILQTISGAVKEVLFFVDEMKETLQPADACANMKVVACIRLLCAYMSEETQALEKEVVKVVPYMIKLGKASFDTSRDELLAYLTSKDEKLKPAVIFMFLLPVLCHWSADDITRAMIIEADFHSTLWEFFCMLVTSKGEFALETIETLTGIFMSIAITEPQLASDPEAIFSPMHKLILQRLGDYLTGHSQLLMSMVTLGLILSRAQLHFHREIADSVIMFFRQCFNCFYETCPFLHGKDQHQISHWPQISELWFVGLDNLMACAAESEQLSKILNGDPITISLRQFVESSKTSKLSDVQQICVALQHFVLTLGKGS